MLKDVLLAKQKEINERLETLLVSDLSAHQKLFDAMNYSLSAGGKRIRPFLFLLILELWGKDARLYLDIACALECVHTYSPSMTTFRPWIMMTIAAAVLRITRSLGQAWRPWQGMGF